MTTLFLVLPLATLLIAVAAQLGGAGKIPRNGALGIRIPSTMASDEAWRAGHRAAILPGWIGFAATTAVAALGVLVARGLLGSVLVAVVCAATVVWVLVAASRAARSVTAEQR